MSIGNIAESIKIANSSGICNNSYDISANDTNANNDNS